MITEFAIANVLPGKLNALVKNIMRQTGERDPNEAVRLVNSGEWAVSKSAHSWREQDGVIYLSFMSDGTTGHQWIERLEDKDFRLTNSAKRALRSPDFKLTSGVNIVVAILKGVLFEDKDRITKKIRAEADKRKLTKPNAEIGCLIRENFSDKAIKAMGLTWIVAMHEPIEDSDDDPCLLSAHRFEVGRCLSACGVKPDSVWGNDCGFAFAVPQVGPQT